MVRVVPAQPVDAFEVGRKAMLYHKVFAKAQNIGCIEKRLFFCGDKEFFSRPFKALFNANLV